MRNEVRFCWIQLPFGSEYILRDLKYLIHCVRTSFPYIVSYGSEVPKQ